ncbi:MAG: glycosyltransferase [Chthoniobacterales bacterium]|nr:glycosyltransferase [Chthoniobacterales bacterium]
MSRPRLLFLATREPTYSRVAIVRRALESRFEVISILSSASSYAARIAQVLWRFLITPGDRYDAIFLCFFAQPIFPLVRLLSRKPIISDCYISLYDSFIKDRKHVSEKHPLAWLCLWLDRQMIKHSTALITDTAAHADYLSHLVPPPGPRIRPVWVSAEQEIFRPLGPVPPTTGEAELRVLFFGAFIPLQGVEVIIRAAALLRETSIRFDLVGAGQTLAACQELDSDLGNTNTVFHPWKRPEELVALASVSQLILGIFGGSQKTARVIPNKVFASLAMARPVLTGDSPAIRELLTPGHDVLTCEMADAQSLAEAIQWCSLHLKELGEIAQNGWETFNEKASPAIVAGLLEDAIMGALRPTVPG